MKLLWALLAFLMCSLPAQAIVTYQGHLVHDGQPYTGTAEVRFSLWDSAEGGNELDGYTSPVQVIDGLFQEQVGFNTLNFNLSALNHNFFAEERWIEVEVLQPGPATTLAPRQRIRRVPRAHVADRAYQGRFSEVPFVIQGPGGPAFRAGRDGGQVQVGIGSGIPTAHLSIGSNLDFWSMGGSFTADRPTIRGTTAGNLSISASGGAGLHINSDGGSGGIRLYDGSGGSSLLLASFCQQEKPGKSNYGGEEHDDENTPHLKPSDGGRPTADTDSRRRRIPADPRKPARR